MNINELCETMEIEVPPVGIYDAPDPEQFEPLVEPKGCIFTFYDAWKEGKTLKITGENCGCPGCGYWMTGTEKFPSRDAFVNFLYNKEGLKATSELMNAWLDANTPFYPKHGNILIGPIQPSMISYLKSVVFFVNPDQLSTLITGAVHHSHPSENEPVIANFGSGCGQLLAMFRDLDIPQGMIGATDIAMRCHLPPDFMTFSVTVPMLHRLLSLDKESSFLGKPFLRRMRSARCSENSDNES